MLFFFFFNDPATTEIYTLSLHDALPIYKNAETEIQHYGLFDYLIVNDDLEQAKERLRGIVLAERSEEHTSELQSLRHLVCRLLLEKKKRTKVEPYKQRRKNQDSQGLPNE